MKRTLLLLLPLAVACSQPEQSPDVKFIMQYEGKLFDGEVRKAIEAANGELMIDFKRSVLNEYWIAKGAKTGVYVKIKEPEYTIMEAYDPSDSVNIPMK